MANPFIGEIIMFGGNFAPRNYAFCNGQLISISQNTALFSILGTTYGGDGRTTFALPDLRGRIAMHKGTGPGLPTYRLGQRGGIYEKTHTIQEMPAHNHPLLNNAYEDSSNQGEPGGNALAEGQFYAPGTPDARTLPADTGSQGQNQSYNIQNPYLTVNFIIALLGTYPSRS